MKKFEKLDFKKLNLKKINFRSKKVIIPMIIVLLMIVIGFSLGNKTVRANGKGSGSTELRIDKVRRGDINTSVTGSGTLRSAVRYEITSDKSREVLKVHKKEGDIVKEGDLIAELDTTGEEGSISKTQRSLQQATQTQAQNYANLKELKVVAPMDGYVTDLTAKVGDSLAKNATIMGIKSNDKYKVTVGFYSKFADAISTGDSVKIFLYSYLTYINGTVTYVADDTYTNVNGELVRDVEILIQNEVGFNLINETVSCEVVTSVTTYSAATSGIISYASDTTVKSSAGGTVKAVYVKSGQYVTAGTLLLEFKNDDVVNANTSSSYNVQDLKTELNTLYKELENGKIYAPCDGIIVSLPIKVKDVTKANSTLAVVADNQTMEFDVDIDELDIDKIKVGQKVYISIDAISSTASDPIVGEVKKIAFEGTTNSGVTVYPVTIIFEAPENVKPGMSVNAEISITESKGVTMIPIEAVQSARGVKFVFVKKTDPNAKVPEELQAVVERMFSDDYYKNSVPIIVTTGVNNDTYIEIKSGLNLGDEIILPKLQASTNSNNSTGTNQTFSMGGMGAVGTPRVITGTGTSNGGGGNFQGRGGN